MTEKNRQNQPYPESAAHHSHLLKTLQSQMHPQCVFCGPHHPRGYRLTFSTHADGHVEASFPCKRLYQGYESCLHGGVIASLLDSAMTNCLFAHGRACLTGELTIRFFKPVVVNQYAIVSARITKSFPPLYCTESIVRQNGQIMAKATAKFMDTSTGKEVCR